MNTNTPTAPDVQPSQSSTKKMLGLVAFAALLLALLGFFHVVKSEDGIIIIAKEHFSFAITFTSIEDVLHRNNGTYRKEPLLQHLVQELERRGKLSRSSPVTDPATEREMARIWKQTQDQGVELSPDAKELVRKYYPDTRRVTQQGEKLRITSPANDTATEREMARIWKQSQDQGVELSPDAKALVRKYYP